MSPIVKKKQGKIVISSKYLLVLLTLFCIVLMLFSFQTHLVSKPASFLANYTIVPFQKGLTSVGTWFINKSDQLAELSAVIEENQLLKEQVAQLTLDNTQLQQDKYELNKLRELFELDTEYDEYDKIGARIIGKDPGNWFSNFVIDKGSNHGIMVNQNVIADGGLVGRVSEVGNDYAKVTSIINDGTNTSGVVLATGDNLIVSGNLETMSQGTVDFNQLVDREGKVDAGDKVVTSVISNQYLPGILIGYITETRIDANNLTKSGTLTPVVDFAHLEEVLVITELKQQVE